MRTTFRASLAALTFVFVAPAALGQGMGTAPLPDGKGKQIVQTVCSTCHATQLINQSSGYTREQWKELTGYMIDLSKSPAQDEILDYLATTFPPSDARTPAKQMPGNFKVTFKEWVMPQLGQRTRDPIQAADGSIRKRA